MHWSGTLEPKSYRRARGLKIDLDVPALDVRTISAPINTIDRAIRFGVTPKAIWQALRKLGVTYKESDAASEGGRRRTACLPRED